jgi:double-stranded uracil-DNA glycosylase
MTVIRSFAPIADNNAEILILGSMPGQASLSANQYYAHQRNAFWRIMAELLQFNPDTPYEEKTKALLSAHIALWDALQSCKRKGSLDAMIETNTQTTNDFQSFFRTHNKITHIFFNGGKAETCFKRYVLQKIDLGSIQLTRLPSTSPAHATLSFEHKREIWLNALGNQLKEY